MEGSTFVESLSSFLPLHQEIVLLLEAISDRIIDFLLFLHVLLNMTADILILEGEHNVMVEGLFLHQAYLRSFLFRQELGSSFVRY